MDRFDQVAKHDRSIGGALAGPIYQRQLQYLGLKAPGEGPPEHCKFGLSEARRVGAINQEQDGAVIALPSTTRDALPPALPDTLRMCRLH